MTGTWVGGAHEGRTGTILDVRAGLLYVTSSDGSVVHGDPREFRTTTGASGMELLEILLPPPEVGKLFHGCVREALVSVSSLSRMGREDSRLWDEKGQFVVADSSGAAALISFQHGSCCGVLSVPREIRDPQLFLDPSLMPPDLRSDLLALAAAPIFQLNGVPYLSACFWSEDGLIRGPEPWPVIYERGAEELQRELSDDDEWAVLAAEYYGIGSEVLAAILRIAPRRTRADTPLVIDESELRILIPPGSPHEEEAREDLFMGGAVIANVGLA